MADDPQPRAQLTRSLRRSLTLLRLLASHGRAGWRLSDLASQSGLDGGTTHRLLSSMADERMVTRVPGTRLYTLGPLTYELGQAAAPHFALGDAARERLATLAAQLGGSLFLKLRSDDESFCLARHDAPRREPALMLDVGGRRPLCGTAGGIAMWMTLSRAEQRRVLARNRLRVEARDPAHWPGVQRMLERSRALGLAVNLGDTVPGICAVAVPLALPGRAGTASMALATSGTEWSESRASDLAMQMHAAQVETLLAPLRW